MEISKQAQVAAKLLKLKDLNTSVTLCPTFVDTQQFIRSFLYCIGTEILTSKKCFLVNITFILEENGTFASVAKRGLFSTGERIANLIQNLEDMDKIQGIRIEILDSDQNQIIKESKDKICVIAR